MSQNIDVLVAKLIYHRAPAARVADAILAYMRVHVIN